MLRISIATAGISLLALTLVTAGGAAAQSAPGKPIQLLQILAKPDKAKPHAKRLSRASRKTHIALAKANIALAKAKTKHPAEAAPPGTAAAPDNALSASAGPANSPEIALAAPATPAAPAAAMDAQSAEPVPSELVVGGHTVQIVSPDETNDIDLAADLGAAPAATAATTATAAAVGKSEPAHAAMFVAASRDDASAVGNVSWIAQILAALGGAVAAGSVAWFLIGSAPQRTYG